MSEPLFAGRYRTDSARWAERDYAGAGLYFVTVCTRDRAPFFGTVLDGEAYLSPVGEMARAALAAIPAHVPAAVLDAFVVMPDHVHVLLGLTNATDPDAEETRGAEDPDAEETRHGASLRRPTPVLVETRHGASPPASDRASTFGLTSAPGPAVTPIPAPAGPSERTFGGLVPGSLPAVVNAFKGAVTRAARRAGHLDFAWQRLYHDRVVRTDRERDHVRAYIADNPQRWAAR